MNSPKRNIVVAAAGAAFGLSGVLCAGVAAAQPTAPEPPPPVEPWYEAFQLGAFADAYGQVDWGLPKPQTGEGAVSRAYATKQGFALSWIGFDASYDPDPVGATVGLRFGPTARSYAGADQDSALEYVKQAYATWRPGGAEGRFSFDFGKFDTIYGAEVAESHGNMNYTRSVLYWFAQPLFHTGLRAHAEVAPELALTALIVNGWNNSVDNNIGKTFGLQASSTPFDGLTVTAGWIGGPEQADFETVDCPAGQAYDPGAKGCAPSAGAPGGPETVDRGGANEFDAWRHLFDLVVAIEPTETLSLLLNADYGVEGVRNLETDGSTTTTTKKWYGAMLGARLQLDPTWAVAARGEYYADPDGHTFGSAAGGDDFALATGTLTLEARPTDNLILRLENRGDFVLSGEPSRNVFKKGERETSDQLFTTTLGVVVTTN